MKFFGVILGLKNAGFRKGLDEARGDVQKFKADVQKGTGVAAGLGSALAGLGISAAVKEIVDYADNIDDLSSRLDVGRESLQKWGKLAEQNGSSVEGVGKALGKLTVAREGALQGNEELINTFASLGISIEDLENLSVDQIMAKIGTGSMNAADMVKVLGKEAVSLRPTLEAAAEGGLGKMSAMSDETIKTLGSAKDEIVGFAGMLKDKLGDALAWVINKWKTFNQTMGATSAAIGMFMGGSSWKDAWGASQKALDDMRAEDAKPDPAKKKRNFDDEEGRQKALAKNDEERKKAEEELQKQQEEMRLAVEDASVKKSDDDQLKIWDRFKLNTRDRHALERKDRADARSQARADRAFERKYGKDELQRVRDLRDPEKQAEAAHKRALATAEQKLEAIKEQAEQLKEGMGGAIE